VGSFFMHVSMVEGATLHAGRRAPPFDASRRSPFGVERGVAAVIGTPPPSR
jgi:hypothetical protein